MMMARGRRSRLRSPRCPAHGAQPSNAATQPGFRPRDLDRSGRRDLVAGLRRHELTIGGVDAWIPPEHFVDANRVERARDALLQVIELAGDFGRVPVSIRWPTPDDGPTMDPGLCDELVGYAERFGVQLIDHAVPPAGRANLGVGVDTAAALSHSLDPATTIISSSPASVRLVDLDIAGMRCPPGSGRLDLVAVCAAISVLSPRPGIVLDMRQWVDPWAGLEQSLRRWRATAGTHDS